eukprot:TRINITY_DN114332_c0_g1_i1.p1 TRINITY_DN114332_c0_g1~~TRINITY_DN114332_c0_g1_i1.p1  ORF type:complete len:424 (-),score=71.41 TRINITY_DN114332_c0_g1_i1:340-1611(-)
MAQETSLTACGNACSLQGCSKQRRCAGAELEQPCLEAGKPSDEDDHDDAADKRLRPANYCRSVGGVGRSVCLRRDFWRPVLVLLVCKICWYAYVLLDLVLPIDDARIRWTAIVIWNVGFVFLLATWVSIPMIGPGEVPPSGPQLPLSLASACMIGKFSRHVKFDATSGWCEACDQWQPLFAVHCPMCQRCCLWGDHHNFYAASCIGFRNMRCYILWHVYSQLMSVISVLLIIVRVVLYLSVGTPIPEGGGWRFFIFFNALGVSFLMGRRRLSGVMANLIAGWPFERLRQNFDSAMAAAEVLLAEMQSSEGQMASAADVEELQKAASKVYLSQGRLRGLFQTDHKTDIMPLVFGEAPSPLYLIPFRSGGDGDPLQPTRLDYQACRDWASLATTMEKFTKQKNSWEARAKAELAAMERFAAKAAA